ncbi:DUF488 domain-containing protein [soil metagenome]
MNRTIFTIGHSTRTIDVFIASLRQIDVTLLLDIRSIPRSSAVPHINVETLPPALAVSGIEYRHLLALGGRRHRPRDAPPSTNTLWRVAAFRNYADYAQTAAFRVRLDELLALARIQQCAIMCAVSGWWRCHRRIVADYLLTRDVRVGAHHGGGAIDAGHTHAGRHSNGRWDH